MGRNRNRRKSGFSKLPSPETGRARRTIVLLVFAVGVLLYINTLQHGFVFDDVTLISQNPQVKNLVWGEILSRNGYRPIRTLTYALNYAWGGLDPFGYHLFNIVLHGINAALVYLLFQLWTGTRFLATAGALLFAAHPVQTAAVAYVSGRKDLLATFFLLLAVYCFQLYRDRNRRFFLSIALVGFVLGFFSKEVAVVFPALIILSVLATRTSRRRTELHEERSLLQAIRRTLTQNRYLYAATLAGTLLGVYYTLFLSPASRMIGSWGGTLDAHIGTSFKLFAHYLKLAFFPYPLIADYTGQVLEISHGLLEPVTVAAILLVAAYLGLAIRIHSRNPRLMVGMIWFLVCLLPVLQIVPFHELAADHFLYLPLVGIVFLIATGLQQLRRFNRRIAWAILGSLLVLFGGLTVDRNRVWANEEMLWEATFRKAPNSYRANTNLGVVYQGQGRWEEAIQHTKKSIELKPDRAISWGNLGLLYRELGKKALQEKRWNEALALEEKAIRHLAKSRDLNREDPFTWSNLGNCYKDLGSIWEGLGDREKSIHFRRNAVRHFERALKTRSRHELAPIIWFNLGRVFMEGGYPEWAIRPLKKTLEAFPSYAPAQYWTGVSYIQLAQYQDAIPYLERAARLQPGYEVWEKLARCYEKVGRDRRALASYLQALRQQPDSAEMHYRVSISLYRLGDSSRALHHLKTALKLKPSESLMTKIHRMRERIRSQSS